MRCPRVNYCDGGLCNYFAVCSNGFVPYWTDSERAGLKAMGGEVKELKSFQKTAFGDGELAGVTSTIRAYVSAARRAKEGA